jgi:hypothetical protein
MISIQNQEYLPEDEPVLTQFHVVGTQEMLHLDDAMAVAVCFRRVHEVATRDVVALEPLSSASYSAVDAVLEAPPGIADGVLPYEMAPAATPLLYQKMFSLFLLYLFLLYLVLPHGIVVAATPLLYQKMCSLYLFLLYLFLLYLVLPHEMVVAAIPLLCLFLLYLFLVLPHEVVVAATPLLYLFLLYLYLLYLFLVLPHAMVVAAIPLLYLFLLYL